MLIWRLARIWCRQERVGVTDPVTRIHKYKYHGTLRRVRIIGLVACPLQIGDVFGKRPAIGAPARDVILEMDRGNEQKF